MFSGEEELFCAATEDHRSLEHMAQRGRGEGGGGVTRAVSTPRGEVKLMRWALRSPHTELVWWNTNAAACTTNDVPFFKKLNRGLAWNKLQQKGLFYPNKPQSCHLKWMEHQITKTCFPFSGMSMHTVLALVCRYLSLRFLLFHRTMEINRI